MTGAGQTGEQGTTKNWKSRRNLNFFVSFFFFLRSRNCRSVKHIDGGTGQCIRRHPRLLRICALPAVSSFSSPFYILCVCVCVYPSTYKMYIGERGRAAAADTITWLALLGPRRKNKGEKKEEAGINPLFFSRSQSDERERKAEQQSVLQLPTKSTHTHTLRTLIGFLFSSLLVPFTDISAAAAANRIRKPRLALRRRRQLGIVKSLNRLSLSAPLNDL